MRPLLLLTFLFLISIKIFSQTKSFVYYFDKDLNTTTQPGPVFTGTGAIDSGLLELRVYNIATKKLVLISHFTDSSLAVSQGKFFSYYVDGNLENEGNFEQGKLNGLWQKWDVNKNKIDSSFYENGQKIMVANFIYQSNQNKESVYIKDIKNNKTYKISYNSEGEVIGKDTITENNDPDKIFIKTEVEATFPGGPKAFKEYITKQLEENADELEGDGVSGTCRVRFIVDIDGIVSNVEALSMRNSVLAKVAIEAIAKGPKWIPAQQNGRAVKAYKWVNVLYPIPDN